MALRLKNPKQVPRGGYVYVEPATSFHLGGMYSFGYVTDQIVAHRKGNSLPRATKAEAAEDLENYTLNLDPSLGYDPGHVVEAQSRSVAGCASCGIKTL